MSRSSNEPAIGFFEGARDGNACALHEGRDKSVVCLVSRARRGSEEVLRFGGESASDGPRQNKGQEEVEEEVEGRPHRFKRGQPIEPSRAPLRAYSFPRIPNRRKAESTHDHDHAREARVKSVFRESPTAR